MTTRTQSDRRLPAGLDVWPHRAPAGSRRSTACAAIMLAVVGLALGCTGGSETNAAVEKQPARHAEPSAPQVNARAELAKISDAIPVYADSEYRDDLTRRDAVMVLNQYGP